MTFRSRPNIKRVPQHVWRRFAKGDILAECEACGLVVRQPQRVPKSSEVPCVKKWSAEDRRSRTGSG